MSGRRFWAASFLTLAAAIPAYGQQISVAVGDAGTTAVAPGGTISIPVVVDMSAAGGLNLASIQFDLNWDAARLNFVSSALGNFGSGEINEGQTASGVLTAGIFSTTGTTSSFTALTLTLTAGVTEGPVPITINVTAAGNEPGQSIISNIVTTDLNLCVGIVGQYGDANGDGAVNIIDAQQIARFSVGLSVADPDRMLTHGDVNGDGATNIIDAQQVARVSVGLPTSGRTGDPVSGGCADPPPGNQLPTATITAPANAASFDQGTAVSFQGSGTDPEDGVLTGAGLAWTSSINNSIGTGVSFSKSDLSVGQHTITLTATDSNGGTGTATVSITIVVSPVGPIVQSITPSSGNVGDLVTLSGQSLVGTSTTVTVGGADATPFIVSNTSSQIILNMPNAGAAGTHNVIVTVGGTVASPVQWTQLADSEPTEPNNGAATAVPVTLPFTTVASFLGDDTQDLYAFTLSSPGEVVIDLQWNTVKDLDILVVNPADFADVLCFDGATTQQPEQSVCNLQAGAYILGIVDFNAQNGDHSLVSYRVEMQTSVTPPPPSGFNIDIRYLDGTTPTASQRQAFDDAAARWESLIIGDLQDLSVNFAAQQICGPDGIIMPALNETIDDLLIFVEFAFIDGFSNTLAQASPCAARQAGTGAPYIGLMRFDTFDLGPLENDGTLVPTVLHEMGHVLGIGTLWGPSGFLQNPVDSLPSGPLVDTHFSGTQAIVAFDAIGGTTYTGGAKVPVENDYISYPGGGSVNGHWRESVLGLELMSSETNPGFFMPLSILTVASLEDLGFGYVVDSNQADPYSPSLSLVMGNRAPGRVLKNDILQGVIMLEITSISSHRNPKTRLRR